jgi:hypothetical protein
MADFDVQSRQAQFRGRRRDEHGPGHMRQGGPEQNRDQADGCRKQEKAPEREAASLALGRGG